MPRNTLWLLAGLVLNVAFAGFASPAYAQFVPGTGNKIQNVGDDFEDPEWAFYPNLPKASSNIDKQTRYPSGGSKNNRFLESLFRGTPDLVQRVETPAGGIPGSKGALSMRTLQSGIPGRISNEFQQDDLIANVSGAVGGPISVARQPSVVCRVYIPPFELWEQRTGSHFGFRADCQTIISKSAAGGFLKRVTTSQKQENYWPGFFLQLHLKGKGAGETFAQILIRSGSRGEDLFGPKITQTGWWTLGMSFTSDGKVHYYGKPGVEKLTAKDHLASTEPYGYRAQTVSTFFFNVVNQDDAKSWSSEWIVDDPEMFLMH